jgi:hypothetical protein
MGHESSTISSHSFSAARWKIRQLAFRSPDQRTSWRFRRMSSPSFIPFLHSGRFRRLLSSVRLLGAPLAILSLPDPWRPFAVQEWHGGSTALWQRTTCTGTHHHSRPVSSAVGGALRLDAGPHICPPVLRQFPLRPPSLLSRHPSWLSSLLG